MRVEGGFQLVLELSLRPSMLSILLALEPNSTPGKPGPELGAIGPTENSETRPPGRPER